MAYLTYEKLAHLISELTLEQRQSKVIVTVEGACNLSFESAEDLASAVPDEQIYYIHDIQYTVDNKSCYLQADCEPENDIEYPVLPEKRTIKEWFELVKDPVLKKAMLENMEPDSEKYFASNKRQAILNGTNQKFWDEFIKTMSNFDKFVDSVELIS